MVRSSPFGSRPSALRANLSGGTREKAALPAPENLLDGDQLFAAVNQSMIAFHQEYHRRPPVTAKARLLGDDLLACVLGDAINEVETTMIELQRKTILQETRSPFQEAMQHKLIAAVERLSGRHVQAFISNSRVDPEIEIELFMLKPRSGIRTSLRGGSLREVRGCVYELES
jgi:uncharacterized protein YbcI